MGVFQYHRVMAEFVKGNFSGNPKFHPHMFMFVLETIFPWVDLKGVSVACDNVSALPLTVINLAS